MKAIKRSTAFVFLMMATSAVAQNVMTSSPYSMFGVGEIASGLYGQNVGMGNVAYGMRGSFLINSDNPAGLTALDSCSLMAEASVFLKSESYKSGGNSNHAVSGNMSAFSLGGRIMPRWYMAAGVTPYSFVGYYFQSSQPLEGSANTYYQSTFEGDGGLSKAHLTQAFMLTRNLSVGVNLNYLFGNITQTEKQSTMSIGQTSFAQAVLADFGLQYHRSIGKESALTLGAVYGYRQRISMSNSITITNGEAVTEQKQKKQKQYLPQFIGLGGAWQYKKMTYALDYTFREYSSLVSDDNLVKFKDTHELRAGVCYSPNGFLSESVWRRFSYKAGINLSTPYMRIRGKSGNAYRVSAGLGMPVLGGQVNAAVFYERSLWKGNVLDRRIIGATVTYALGERLYKVKH